MKRTLAFALLLAGATSAYGEMYTWRDSRGTVFYTNSIHEIPARYLRKARVYDVTTGKKGGPATGQAVAATTAKPVTPDAPQSGPSVPIALPPQPLPVPSEADINGLTSPAERASSANTQVGAPVPQRETLAQRRLHRRRDFSGTELE